MADAERAYRASYLLSGIPRERIFAALTDVRSFPDWAVGLASLRATDPTGSETGEIRAGTTLEFSLRAAGLTHKVTSAVTFVEPPRRLEWSYTRGARGTGGWLVEDSGPGAVRMTLATDYRVSPAWLNTIAHRPFFRRLTEDLLRRSIRRFEQRIRQRTDPEGSR